MSDARRVTAQLENFTNSLVKQIVLDATSNFIEDTPVDTGWARANWIPNIGEPFNRTSSTREQAEAGSVQRGDQQAGLATIAATYEIGLGAVYITNNVPYIIYLNEGSSQQAPSGFVQSGISRALRRANSRANR